MFGQYLTKEQRAMERELGYAKALPLSPAAELPQRPAGGASKIERAVATTE